MARDRHVLGTWHVLWKKKNSCDLALFGLLQLLKQEKSSFHKCLLLTRPGITFCWDWQLFIGQRAGGGIYLKTLQLRCVQEGDSCLFLWAECATVERLTLDTPASGCWAEASFYQQSDITLRGWGRCRVWQTGRRGATGTCRGTLFCSDDGSRFRDATRKY